MVVPGSIETLTGGTIYDRRVCQGLRERGWEVRVIELDASFPHPTPAALANAEAHYRFLVENAPYAIYALDVEGGFIELNPAGERILEVPAVDLGPSPDLVCVGFRRCECGGGKYLRSRKLHRLFSC